MKKLCPNGHLYDTSSCRECRQPKREGKTEYGWRWDELSRRKRTVNPLCEDCDFAGRTTAASEVHHIVPINQRPDLKFAWSNLVSLCKSCHSRRHRELNDEE